MTPIHKHEGSKYIRVIYPAGGVVVNDTRGVVGIEVDVYEVIEAFPCRYLPNAVGHAIKKLLFAGCREKGSVVEDLVGALAAINRAIEIVKRQDLINQDLMPESLADETAFATLAPTPHPTPPVIGFCPWCPDPKHPDSDNHPDGQSSHVFKPQGANGHWFLPETDVCRYCGISRVQYKAKSRPWCVGQPPPSDTKVG